MDTTARPLSSIGIDIGKEVFHVVGFSTDGKIAFRRKIKRLALVETFRRLPPSVVGMEACLSAHFVSRAFANFTPVRCAPSTLHTGCGHRGPGIPHALCFTGTKSFCITRARCATRVAVRLLCF